MLLMILVSCVMLPFESNTETPDVSEEDLSSYKSPCLDGLADNMRKRSCIVEVFNDSDGKNRYYCKPTGPTSPDVWTTSAFVSWETGAAPSEEVLSGLDYKKMCSDWSLEIFYR